MISRVYTPPVAPYSRSQRGGLQRGVPTPTEENPSPFRRSDPGDSTKTSQPDGNPASSLAPAAGLQSVQYDRSQQIPLNAVLGDFHKTMTSLGADDATRAEVGVYLRAISLQGGKPEPDVPFIRHTLRTAANTLDQYIGNTLGQSSKVVREWVDALLLQNIDFHSDTPFEPPGRADIAGEKASPEASGNPVGPSETQNQPTEQASRNALDTEGKKRLKSLIESAKAAHESGNAEAAANCLEEALAQLKDKGFPEWEGKIHRLYGRFAEGDGAWEKAMTSYGQAADCFQAAGRSDREADTRHAMASILEDHGRLTEAREVYRQVLALDEGQTPGDIAAQIRTLQDLGRVDLRQGQTTSALEHLATAVTRSQQAQREGQTLPIGLQVDLLSNLGAVYRRAGQGQEATQSYREAARLARVGGDAVLYANTLQQYAATLVEGGRNTDAMKVLQAIGAISVV
jgi:tetratricopeptide (TPR) repeat protein